MVEYHVFKSKIKDTARVSGKVSIGSFTEIEDFVKIHNTSKNNSIDIGKRCKIKQGAVLKSYGGFIKIGDRVSIGENCNIAGHGGVLIGDYTIIAGLCYISSANHIFSNFEPIRFQGETSKGISIGKNVWIGGMSMILDGVKIGDGAIIGAGSIVTKDMPEYSVCYGTPCEPIKIRKKEDLNEICYCEL